MYNDFYSKYPHDEEERQRMLLFHKLEKNIDRENAAMFEKMDKSHLNKTNLKKSEAAIKRWHTETQRTIKNLSSITNVHHLSRPRTWIR